MHVPRGVGGFKVHQRCREGRRFAKSKALGFWGPLIAHRWFMRFYKLKKIRPAPLTNAMGVLVVGNFRR